MALNKKSEFGKEENELADLARSIGHPARVAILKILARGGTCICNDIVSGLPLAQSTVSQHLAALQRAGLIKATTDGVRSCYCINWSKFERFTKAFNLLCDNLEKNKNCC